MLPWLQPLRSPEYFIRSAVYGLSAAMLAGHVTSLAAVLSSAAPCVLRL
jgi:hypothetical protein